MNSKIDKIKAACSIEWAWTLLGLPGKPGRTCHCPWRVDNKPSFSVYLGKDGSRFFDHANGMKGDIVDFFAMATDITVPEAIEKLLLMTGQADPPRPHFKASETKLEFPAEWRLPTEDECCGLAILRGLPADTFHTAGLLGTLRVGAHPRSGELLWWITDQCLMGAEGRTFTGEPCIASGKKSAALPGTRKGWPYGLMTSNPWLNDVMDIVLCEGGPDYLAAVALATVSEHNFRPVTMLGASCTIGDEAAQHLKGRRVLILPHNDAEGIKAAENWTAQLRDLGAAKRTVQRLPSDVKDLNEFYVRYNTDPDYLQILKGFEKE